MSGVFEAEQAMFRADCDRIRASWIQLGELNPDRRDDVYLEMGFPPELTNDALLTQFRKDGVHGMADFLEAVVAREVEAAAAGRWVGKIRRSSMVDVNEVPAAPVTPTK
ncbi:hypothetical protein ACF044_13280 [Microbacterium sp. NPDC016588]